jgi:hypothetical protein
MNKTNFIYSKYTDDSPYPILFRIKPLRNGVSSFTGRKEKNI